LTHCRKREKLLVSIILLGAIFFSAYLLSDRGWGRFNPLVAKLSSIQWGHESLSKTAERLTAIDPARVGIWKKAYGYWKLQPLTGIGLGAFQYMPNEHFTHAHNFVFDILVEQGIIGMAFLISFLYISVKRLKGSSSLLLLACLLFSQLFDDLSLFMAFPVYVSLILGYCFRDILQTEARGGAEL